MKDFIRKHKKLVITFLILLAAVIVWASSELSGQANRSAADAGSNSMDMEIATMDMVAPPKQEQAPNCDWMLEKELREKIDANNVEYEAAVQTAKSEVSSMGQVTQPTRDQVLGLAQEYKNMNDQYAAMWQECNCITRANLAIEAGETRMKSADVVVNEIDSEKLDALQAQQDKLAVARKEYAQQAKDNDELAPEDKQRIQAQALPRAERNVENAMAFLSEVESLLWQVQNISSDISTGNYAGMAACGARAAMSGDLGLLTNVQTLFYLAEAMLSNGEALVDDINYVVY